MSDELTFEDGVKAGLRMSIDVVHSEARWQWELDSRHSVGAQTVAQRMGVVEDVLKGFIDRDQWNSVSGEQRKNCIACSHPAHGNEPPCGAPITQDYNQGGSTIFIDIVGTCTCQWKFVSGEQDENSIEPRNWFVGNGVLTLYTEPLGHVGRPCVHVRPATVAGEWAYRVTHLLADGATWTDDRPDLVSALRLGQERLR